MSQMTQAISSRFSVILAISALLTWVVCIPGEVRADDPNQMMTRGGHPEHGRAMHDFVGHSLHRLLRHGKDLGLSQEQRAKIKAIVTDYTKTRIREEADLTASGWGEGSACGGRCSDAGAAREMACYPNGEARREARRRLTLGRG